MNPSAFGPAELKDIYSLRFQETAAYRNEVWKILTASFFQKYLPAAGAVLDLGCGYGEFINNIQAEKKFGMDLNSESAARLGSETVFFKQDCSHSWPLPDSTLDAVFTSNFFEHLPDNGALSGTLKQVERCLKPGGKIICLGPNIKYLPGAYWDFWDHHLPLTELSLQEALRTHRLETVEVVPKFLPYTMVNAPRYPLIFLRIYLRCSFLWPIFGRQFLVVGRKPHGLAR